MCEARTKALLHSLNAEFELWCGQADTLKQQNSLLAVEVAKLESQLDLSQRSKEVRFSLSKNSDQLLLLDSQQRSLRSNLEKTQADSGAGTIVAIDDVSMEDLGHEMVTGQLESEQRQEKSKKHVEIPRSYTSNNTFISGTTSLKRFLLWPAWQEEAVSDSHASVRLARSMITDNGKVEAPFKNVKYGEEMRSPGILQRLVTRPSSPRQIVWDLLSVVFMCIDVLMVPMQAFPLPKTKVAKTLDWATVVFWTIDIPSNFLTGYHHNGIFEMRPAKIAKRYARKMFLVDLTVVLVDWAVVLQDSNFMQNIGAVRILKSYRFARALRLIRVVRVAKLVNAVGQISDQMSFFHSETIKIVIDITKLFLFIVVASHFLACGWYALGTAKAFRENGLVQWVELFAEEHGGDPSVGYRYTTALQWALTQFTPASMEVVPRNTVERIYAVIVLVLGVVTFSSFVSSITSSMTRLRMMNMDRAKQRDDISRYIIDHRMTLSVGNRINQFLRKRDQMMPPRVHEEDVSLFRCLPEALRVDMHREVYLPVLCPHPFFNYYYSLLDDASLATICHTGMHERASAKGEYIFNWGETATHMFFIQSGVCEYSLGAAMHNDVLDIGANGMLSEAVLWVPWEHVGRLLVVKHVELATLDSAVMQGALRGQPAAKAARKYAVQFLERQLQDKTYTDLCTEMAEALDMAQNAWGVETEQDVGAKSVFTQATQRVGNVRDSMTSLVQNLRVVLREGFLSKSSTRSVASDI